MASSKLTVEWIKQVFSDPKELEKRSGQSQKSWHESSPAGYAHRANLTHSVYPVAESHSLAWEVAA